MNLLITAFEPFAGRSKNKSYEVAEYFDNSNSINVILLPVSFEHAHIKVKNAISSKNYDLVIMLGETSATKDFIRLERLALNFKDSENSDNMGISANEESIIPGAPGAYFTNFPIKSVCRELQRKGCKVKISNSAGTFVCNSLYYHILHYIEENKIPTSALFVHLPSTTEIITLDEMINTIRNLIIISEKVTAS